jgi:Rod binding domain-containing protein
VPTLIARVQGLSLKVHSPAKIVVNERTGTIVMGGNVKLSPVSVIHGSLSIQVVTTYTAAQPGLLPMAPPGNIPGARNAPGGQSLQPGVLPPPVLVPQTEVNVNDGPAESMRLDEGANVDELVSGLHALGTTARDVVAILQAIKAEGGMQAELEVQQMEVQSMGSSATFGSLSAQSNALESREDLMMRQFKSPAGLGDDAKIAKGAKEFEAILVGSWLQQAEQSFATVPGTDDDADPGASQMMSLGVQQLATSMAASGGIGIGKMIAKAMHANADKARAQTAASADLPATSAK